MIDEARKYAHLPYFLQVVPERCTDGSVTFLASNPELPGCMSHGDTPEEAIRNLAEARELYISELLIRSIEVPIPAFAETGTSTGVETAIWYMSDIVETPKLSEARKPESDKPNLEIILL